MTISKIDWRDKETMFQPEKWTWIELLNDFNIPLGFPTDSHSSETLELKKGDVFAISIGEYIDITNDIKESLFITCNDTFSPCFMSCEFLKLNEIKSHGKLFVNVTTKVLRNKKINQILN